MIENRDQLFGFKNSQRTHFRVLFTQKNSITIQCQYRWKWKPQNNLTQLIKITNRHIKFGRTALIQSGFCPSDPCLIEQPCVVDAPSRRKSRSVDLFSSITDHTTLNSNWHIRLGSLYMPQSACFLPELASNSHTGFVSGNHHIRQFVGHLRPLRSKRICKSLPCFAATH